MAQQLLQLGIPAGSLQEATCELFRKAGYRIKISSRSYYPTIDDPEIECLLIRAQEMARYVEQGILDAGITGHDWVLETEAKVTEVCELVFSKVSRRPVRWVLCVPNDSPIEHPWLGHLDRSDPGDQGAGRVMAVANHLLMAAVVREGRVPLDPAADLRLNGLPQQALRAVAEDLGEHIAPGC